MNRYLVRVTVGFAVGGLVAGLGSIFSGGIPADQSFDVLIQFVAFSIGGAIGGASLGKGWRSVIGFGLAFGVFGAVCPIKDLMGGGCMAPPVIFTSILSGLFSAIAFGLVGAIGGTAISGLGGRLMLAGARAFGGAGFIGGMVLEILKEGQLKDSEVFLVSLLITYALGGAWFGMASEYHSSHQRKKLGLCIKCGYDLQGPPQHGHQCPECGTPFELSVNKPLNSSTSLPPVSLGYPSTLNSSTSVSEMLRPYPRKK
jgi:hypothetical protein